MLLQSIQCRSLCCTVGPCWLSIFLTIYLCLTVLGLHCWVGFSLVVESGGYSLVVVHGHLIVAASLVLEHGL